MLKKLNFQNFKSWKDTGDIRLAPLTGFFGTNSSGKTTILQLLLMLKQTVESNDRQRILHTGDEHTYVDLGTFYDLIYKHQIPGSLNLSLDWDLAKTLQIDNPEGKRDEILFSINSLNFSTEVELESGLISVKKFAYSFIDDKNEHSFGMQKKVKKSAKNSDEYELVSEGYPVKRVRGRVWPLPQPVKSYGFPDQVNAFFQNAGFISDFTLAFEELFQRIHYLGPLREYPRRSYIWAGERPQDVGRRGELAIPALLASRNLPKISLGKGRKRQTIEERIAFWLKELGLIDEFQLKSIAENRKEYEVRVRRSPNASEVLITDVGFGISQILPVLVLCYYAQEGSTIILEQPEIHLHPSVQAGLADIFIDVIKTRNIQILLESHSEHLLRRLQRRIAEEYKEMKNTDAALYFCEMSETGTSQLKPLELDEYGNINTWPVGFFGDEMGDLVAMTEAAMRRQGGN